MNQEIVDSILFSTNDAYIKIINLKRSAYRTQKTIKGARIVTIIFIVISTISLLLLNPLVIPLLVAYIIALRFLKNKNPVYGIGLALFTYTLPQIYQLGSFLYFEGIQPSLFFSLIIPSIFIYFLVKALPAAKLYEKTIIQLQDLNVDTTNV